MIMVAKSRKNEVKLMLNLAISERKRDSMSVFEALMLMIAFATLVVHIIDDKEDKK